MQESFLTFLGENLQLFLTYTGVYNATPGHLIMILVGLLFIFLAIKYEFEPMLLIPIGFGILIGNIPFKDAGLQVGIYEQGSVLNILYQGVTSGWYPPWGTCLYQLQLYFSGRWLYHCWGIYADRALCADLYPSTPV